MSKYVLVHGVGFTISCLFQRPSAKNADDRIHLRVSGRHHRLPDTNAPSPRNHVRVAAERARAQGVAVRRVRGTHLQRGSRAGRLMVVSPALSHLRSI